MVPRRALAEADGDPFLGMMVGERFAVLELLGAGSMGTVYRAHQEATRRDVALKIVRSDRLVDKQAKSRFQQEAHATSLLTSSHTVTVFDFGEICIEGDDPHYIDGSMFLAMELLKGEALGTRIKRLGRITPTDAVQIMREALLSLSEAHDKGVIHRDLKPDNLLMVRSDTDRQEFCKVLDFGIAKVLTHQEGVDALETQAGTVFGTPRYMSPEQAQGKVLDARSDLYSLGVILYHMLLGRPPYTDNDAVVVMAHHIKTVPKRPSRIDPELVVPRALEDLMMRVLDKDPNKRPRSANQFIQEIDRLGPLDADSVSAELTAVVGGLGGRVAPGSRRMVMLGGIVVASVVGLSAAVLVTEAEKPIGARSIMGAAAVGAGAQVLGGFQDSGTVVNEEMPDADEDAEAAASASAARLEAPPPVKVNKKRDYERFDR